MAGRLQGKRCFVTAAGQGIGRATALAYAAEGASVVATDRDAEKLGGPATASRRWRSTCWTTPAVAAAVAAAGPLDVLFNCAGFVHQDTIRDRTDDDWDFAFDLNVRAMWQTIRAALPGMLGQGRRLDRQHVLGLLEREGRAEPVPLWHHQGGGDRADQVGRHRLRHARHPLQRDLPGHGGYAEPRRAHRRQCGAGRRAGAARAAFVARQADGAARHAPRRSRRWSSISRRHESTFVTGQAIVIDGGWML